MAEEGPRALAQGEPSPAADGGEEDRTQLLVATAIELLDEVGLDGLTIRAVLSRSGLARRCFYERFRGKDDLVLAAFEATLREAAALFARIEDESDDPLEILRRMIAALVIGELDLAGHGGNLRSAALAREHMRLAESRPADLAQVLRPLLGRFEAVVARGIACGAMRQADPVVQARLIYNLVSTTTQTTLIAESAGAPDRATREQLNATLWDFCRRAIVA